MCLKLGLSENVAQSQKSYTQLWNFTLPSNLQVLISANLDPSSKGKDWPKNRICEGSKPSFLQLLSCEGQAIGKGDGLIQLMVAGP